MAPMFSPISPASDVSSGLSQEFGEVKATPQMVDFTLTQTTDSRGQPGSTLSLLDIIQPSSLLFSRGANDSEAFFHFILILQLLT